MECLDNLIGLRDLCEADAAEPLFWLDDIEGIDRISLAQLAKPSNGSGKAFGTELIESSQRFLIADIETLIPKGYSIKAALNSFCNTCTYTGLASTQPLTGVIVKNISTTTNGYLSIDSLKVMIDTTGDFTIVLDDSILPKIITDTFTAGVEKIITNISYKTIASQVKIYFLDADVAVTALNCPTTKSCGCSGSQQQSKDLQVKGLLNNVEFTTQYGFIPCASVVCSLDNILCAIVNQQPKLFALSLLYRSAARLFSESLVTQRNNLFASWNKDEKEQFADRYMALYNERLRGSDTVKGISDNMAAALNNLNDSCIECSRQIKTAWASG